MATGTNGAKLSLYFDKTLWKELDLQSCKLSMSPNDFVRHAVRKYLDNEAVEEIEKLQRLNAKMFKYLANKLSHIEMLSTIAKDGFEEKNHSTKYADKLHETKIFNQKIVEEMIDETIL